MSADKFLKLQTDVRHNQEDLQSFLRDLKSWETSIKKTDHQLKKGDSAPDEKKLPPIRHKKEDAAKKRRKKKPARSVSLESEVQKSDAITQEVNTSTKEGMKIRAYDYRSWDKFDVDAACAALDSDDERSNQKATEKEEEEEYETDSDAEREEMEAQRKIMEANAEKEKGNAFFKKGCYEDAVTCYSKGLKADPNNALLSANRAMAFLKLKRFEEAEKDCDEAIGLDYTYVKAFARRGTARLELGKLEEAKKDFEQVLNIESDNKQAKNEIRKIESLLREREEERRRSEEPSNIVHAIDKPLHCRSKKPLKRMVIQEIGKGVAEEKQRRREQLKTQTKTDIVPINDDKSPSQIPAADNVNEKQHRIQEIRSRTEENVAGNKENLHNSVTHTDKGHSNQKGKAELDKVKVPSVSASKPAVPGIPSSSFQLQADWKRLKGHPDLLFEYFKKIPPTSYEKLFQNSLDSAMLNQILSLLKESYILSNTPMFETLDKLSTVKRFTMNIMFMSSKEKQVVRDIFTHLTSENSDEQRCHQLAKKYGL